jgi:hypothetical protein
MFGGMPFIQDTQVGAFYPPHFLLYHLPESRLGAALSWLVLLHVVAAGEGLGGSLRVLFRLVGPSLTDSGLTSNVWEYRGGVGFLWLALATLAPVLERGRVRFQASVLLLVLLFGVAGEAASDWPVFGLFRLPSRMLTFAALPLALLAGVTTNATCAGTVLTPVVRRRCFYLQLAVLLFTLLILAGEVGAARGQTLRLHPYWISLAVTVPALSWLLFRPGGLAGPLRVAWAALLLLDLWALLGPLVAVCSADEIYQASACVAYLANRREEPGRVLVRDLQNQPASTPLGADLSMVDQIETLGGYSSLDLYHFKQYVQFISDSDKLPNPGEWLVNFPVKNKALLDLFGVRFLLQPGDENFRVAGEESLSGEAWQEVFVDREPKAHLLITGYRHGLQTFPPYSVYENKTVYPRAFVVPQAAPLPPHGSVLQALKETDLRQTVLLADVTPEPGNSPSVGHFRPAVVTEYQPNHVTVDVEDGTGGWLVLAEVWFPGWTCTIDGQPTPIARADYLFRAVRLPEGAHEVVFTFAPTAYRWGQLVSAAAVCAVLAVTLLAALSRRGRGRRVVVR